MAGTTGEGIAEIVLRIISGLSIFAGAILIIISIYSDEFTTLFYVGIGSIISGTLFNVVVNISISLKKLVEMKSEEHKTALKQDVEKYKEKKNTWY